MIPKVRSVESLILMNQSSVQLAVRFRKIIFHKGSQFLLLQQKEQHTVMKIKCCDNAYKLIGANREEYEELSGYFQGIPVNLTDTEEEYWVVGIGFNKVENQKGMSTEFRISNEKPLDVLPYIIQTGVEHVFFSE
ncbi:hypothetical protein [Paenibacillus naphthalenovorans]|uniref:hypothetical protein n=1 Tax=Paenibacillus naphthalenovorans TaxID=162209 RepID=UPI00088735DA|nr:hypothetical protein [Paenibacillus naphthalenovorans]SDJ44773.1 hypothetical protein SAMN05421868_12764 [Paenibacillus naphthalenovorans]